MPLRTMSAIAESTGVGGYFFKSFTTSTGGVDLTLKEASSSAPNVFLVSPSTVFAPAGVIIRRVNLSLVDGSIKPGSFAGQTALTNGVKIAVTTSTGGVVFDFLDGQTIKNNSDWALLSGVDQTIRPAAGDDALPIRWTLGKAGSRLLLRQGQQLRITVQDASSGITIWTAMAQGHYEMDRTL